MPAPLLHTAFYFFTPLPDPDAVVERLRVLTTQLNGSILVAHEGINGVLAGPPEAVAAFEQALVSDGVLQGVFATITFKRSACQTPPFARMKVHKKPQIVAVGLPQGEASCGLPGGTVLNPQAWRALLAQDGVVVVDNRNSFEFRLGRFKRALDPQVANFRDFPPFIAAHADQWRAEGKKVAMYCTGGIRCEKTGPWMVGLGLDVYQLEGGILNYFQTLPDAALDWEGECFVFDNRIALDTQLQETQTTLEAVYQGAPDGAWRMARARRLAGDVAGGAMGDVA
jgi:UPF0176 protein